jgi:pimeloyl-ACP methyl ester carboxylesterase
MKPTVIAFHGQGGSGQWLREDCCEFYLIDYYFDGFNVAEAIRFCDQFDRLILVGYSRGGQLAAKVAIVLKDKMAGIMLYESKPLKGFGKVTGDYPALIVWNDQGRGDSAAGRRTDSQWSTHPFQRRIASGKHLKRVPGRRPAVGHGWDCASNEMFAKIILEML